MALFAKNETLVSEKDTLAQQVKELTIENVRLQNSLALAQARVVSSRGGVSGIAPPTSRQEESHKEEGIKEKEESPAEEKESASAAGGSTARQTRSQTQRSQDQQARELLLSKTRSRPSYIPKPSSSRVSLAPKSATNKENTQNNTQNNNKENTQNNNEVMAEAADSEIQVQARKQRTSMIPIRKGSSLLPQPSKTLRTWCIFMYLYKLLTS